MITGIVLDGSKPPHIQTFPIRQVGIGHTAHTVYRSSLPIGMPIPHVPRSPVQWWVVLIAWVVESKEFDWWLKKERADPHV